MEDREILALYNARNEDAITQSEIKFGAYCYAIAYAILSSEPDAEETENDALLKAWNRIPPDYPLPLRPFFGMLTRQTAIDRYRMRQSLKRGGGEYELSLDELEECVSGQSAQQEDTYALREAINGFLRSLPREKRIIFLRRYFYISKISEIAADFALSEGKVKMILLRLRQKLKEKLREEGLYE